MILCFLKFFNFIENTDTFELIITFDENDPIKYSGKLEEEFISELKAEKEVEEEISTYTIKLKIINKNNIKHNTPIPLLIIFFRTSITFNH